jgi:hypothetical protein
MLNSGYQEGKDTEGIVSYYCTVLPIPAFIFSAWEKLRILKKHVS